VIALFFAGCLRFTYFKEWPFDADTKNLYRLAKDLHDKCGVANFAVDWRYTDAMNFYRIAHPSDSMAEFGRLDGDKLPVDRNAYIVGLYESGDFTSSITTSCPTPP
jgi:hypothetical protein